MEAKVLQTHHHGMATAVLCQRQFRATPTHLDGIHDLVGLAHLEDAVLVDSGTMSKGIFSDDGLAAGYLQATQATDEPGGFKDLAGLDPRGKSGIDIGTGLDRHDDLLERRVAGTLADTIECPFDLSGTGLHGRERIRHGHAEIVMAMDTDHRLGDVSDMVAQVGDQVGVLTGHRVADGVGDIDRVGASLDCSLHNLCQKLRLGTGGILRGELHIRGEGLGLTNPFRGQAQDLLVGFLEFVLAVDLGGGEEDMNATLVPSGQQCLSGSLDILGHTSGQTAHNRSLHLRGDRMHGLEIAVTNDGKSCLDDINLEAGQLAGDLQLLAQIHGGTRALLAVAQGGVEDENSVVIHRKDPEQPDQGPLLEN